MDLEIQNLLVTLASVILFVIVREYSFYRMRCEAFDVKSRYIKLRQQEEITNINKVYKIIDERMEIIFKDNFKNDLITMIALQKNKLTIDEVDEQIIELSKTIFSSINNEDKATIVRTFNMGSEEELLRLIVIKTKNYISSLIITSKVNVL